MIVSYLRQNGQRMFHTDQRINASYLLVKILS